MAKATTVVIEVSTDCDPCSGYDEYDVWYVAICDDDLEPINEDDVHTCYSERAALDLAEELAGDDLEVVEL